MAELREQTVVRGPEPGGSLPQAHRRHARASARHRPRRLTRVTPHTAVQPRLWTLLTPKWRSALRAAPAGAARFAVARALLLALIGARCFWAAVFGIAYRVLSYSSSVEDIGNLLAGKMLGVILLAFLSILLLSNIITALSTFFLAKDLDLLVAAPVERLAALPLQAGRDGRALLVDGGAARAADLHRVRHRLSTAGPLFPFVALAAFIPFLMLPAVVGTTSPCCWSTSSRPGARASCWVCSALGARRRRWCVMLRFMRPEQLARPEGFRNFVDYLAALRDADQPAAAERVGAPR